MIGDSSAPVNHAVPSALNEPQARAVEHGEGPLLVLAGPGSGKTRVVTHRIARLLERGVPATQVLAVTFTNKAAREMRERVRALAGARARGLAVSTFHSACVRILREEIGVLGYGRNFTIYDEGSQQALVRALLRDEAGAGATASASAVLESVGAVKNLGAAALAPHAPGPSGEAVAESEDARRRRERASFLEGFRERYQEELSARNAIDFDDIILLVARIFREHPEVLARWQDRWRWLLVDEYQDTNEPQDEVLRLLAGSRRNLCVVGDDDQSIYAWRGANVEHILAFPTRFPDAVVVRLEENYRSTARVVQAASAVIARNAKRHAKQLFTSRDEGEPLRLAELPDEKEEADLIAHEIATEVNAPGVNPWEAGRRFAILMRTNDQARPLEQALREARVPYRLIGGRSFFDRKEVLDVLAYLRLAGNRADEEALLRIINVPARGLGAKAIQSLRGEAARARETPWATLERVADGVFLPEGVEARVAGGVRELVEVVRRTAERSRARSRTLVDQLLADIGYQAEVERTYKDAGVRVARWNLAREVQQSWEAHLDEGPGASLEAFLDGLALGVDRKDDDESGGGVSLATMHGAKGLEWDVVYVAGCEDGNVPHARSVDDPRALEEERRLFYVALTRARDALVLTRAAERVVRGRAVRCAPSRFLDELPAALTSAHDPRAKASDDSVASYMARVRALGAPPNP